MPLADRSFGQILYDPLEIQVESGSHSIQMGIELGTHPLDLHVGLVPYIFK